MKIFITGFQGEGKSRVARRIADYLHRDMGKSVRVIDGCNSHELPEPKGRYGQKVKVWDVNIRVRQINVPIGE